MRRWIDETGIKRCDATPRTHMRPSFAFIATATGGLIVPHAALRFTYDQAEVFPITVTSRNAPPVGSDDE
ncbi:hypothetical protein [Ancylobacter sp.]|uniref:hypothetical protein n=1 Tax=Ancylobacter sp. TaxID=1872567 RepID=UPI003BAD766A